MKEKRAETKLGKNRVLQQPLLPIDKVVNLQYPDASKNQTLKGQIRRSHL